MALQQTVILDNGLPPVENAYIRITTQSGKDTIALYVDFYASKTAHINGMTCIKPMCIYVFSPLIAVGSINFIEQGYKYLKTLEEFKHSVDC